MASVKTPSEWKHQHVTMVGTADMSLRTSARVRDEAAWVRDQTKHQTDRTQEDVRFRIKEKLTNTNRKV